MFALLLSVVSIANVDAQNKKLSVGVLGDFNFNKTGVGFRFGYNFTDILRFTVDGDYYLTAKRSDDVYSGNSKLYKINNGRLWDVNTNLNFVFGEHNFHFYLITGIGFTYGYKLDGLSGLVDDLTSNSSRYAYNESGMIVGITESFAESTKRIGVSLNAGCGIEWQITPSIRWNLEQQLCFGLPSLTTWMGKTGIAYCF